MRHQRGTSYIAILIAVIGFAFSSLGEESSGRVGGERVVIRPE